jgi:hypothetical protein
VEQDGDAKEVLRWKAFERMPMKPPSLRRIAATAALLSTLLMHGASAADSPSQLTADTRLPPNPGVAGQMTLAGVDSNGNAVRDDLEPYIVQHFGQKPLVLRAVTNIAISMQASMLAGSDVESSTAESMMIRSAECLRSINGQIATQTDKVQQLLEMVVNTPDRKEAMRIHDERVATQHFAVRNEPSWDAYCTQRADLVNP